MTLVNSLSAIKTATNLFADEIGRPRVTEDQILEVIGLPLEETWEEFWGACEPGWVERYRAGYKDVEASGFVPFPDAVPTLKALKAASLKTAVVTNRAMASFVVESAGLKGYIDAQVGADDVANAKPDPEPLLKALGLLGAKAEEAVYLGDTEIDMRAGSGAKIRPVGVTTGPVCRETLLESGAWAVIDSLGELLPLIGVC
jgi:HAD superfamily hydrolase (TIGR01549 family)